MTKFKIGDKVRRTSFCGYSNGRELLRLSGVYTVSYTVGDLLALKEFAEEGAVWAEEFFELVETPVISKTDEELASEYRKLRSQATAISQILIDRGYVVEWRTEQTSVWHRLRPAPTQEYQFYKTEVKKIVI